VVANPRGTDLADVESSEGPRAHTLFALHQLPPQFVDVAELLLLRNAHKLGHLRPEQRRVI
jgi:hypothetical protein